VLVGLAARSACAQDEPRPPLTGRDFNIDLVTGPVLGAGRAVGLGGAYTALATGADGGSWNAASYAARGHWDIDWFEWELTLNLVPGAIRNSDFDNNGESGFTYDTFLFGTLGVCLQFGAFGVGGLANIQSYQIDAGRELLLAIYNYAASYAFAQGQLIAGLGLRTASLTIGDMGGADPLVDVAGTGPEAGALLRLAGQPWRLGVAARLPVETAQPDTLVAAGLMLPRHIHMPWEVQVGAALQLGPRPLNRLWVNPHDVSRRLRDERLARRKAREREQYEREAQDARMQLAQERTPPHVAELGSSRAAARALPEGTPRDPDFWQREAQLRDQEARAMHEERERLEAERKAAYENLSRRYLLLSAETIFVGPTENGVGMESFLSSSEHASGRDVTVGFRAGIEGEPIAHWLQMRAGTYFEPSRFEGVPYRVHGTLGADVRLVSWDLFGLLEEFTLRAGASADVAERYLNVGVGIGLWH
jgi:hypothetical protein